MIELRNDYTVICYYLVRLTDFRGKMSFEEADEIVPVYYKVKTLTVLFSEIMYTRKIVHGTVIEVIWTIIPTLILICIAIPSFSLLYSMDEIIEPHVTVKAIGYQWFWSYEYGQNQEDLGIQFNYLTDVLKFNYKVESKIEFEYDSVLIPDDELILGEHRLLEVDEPLVLPVDTHIRLIVTAGDVLHSWAVPALGIKIDAVPGRLSQVGLYIKRAGVFYGQCSELCGVNHGFMPIVVHAVSVDDYIGMFYDYQVVWPRRSLAEIQYQIDDNGLLSFRDYLRDHPERKKPFSSGSLEQRVEQLKKVDISQLNQRQFVDFYLEINDLYQQALKEQKEKNLRNEDALLKMNTFFRKNARIEYLEDQIITSVPELKDPVVRLHNRMQKELEKNLRHFQEDMKGRSGAFRRY